jgi:glycosyltransferase involved in cell wall biosynthesis
MNSGDLQANHFNALDTNECPTVSVCVSNYNYGRFLGDLIESVQQQTFTDWELVITDDLSSDGSEEIVRAYVKQDARIRFIRNECRLGMNGNLQRAASSGRGKYLKILCADDWLAPSALAVLVGIMEQHPESSLLTSGAIYADQEGRPLFIQHVLGTPLSVFTGEKMLDLIARGTHYPGGNSDFFVRKSCFDKVGGYDTSLLYAGDFGLALRLCRVGGVLHTDEPAVYWRVHPASSTNNDPGRLYDVHDFLTIPRKAFQPRHFLTREWRRCHQFAGRKTAQFMVTAVSQFFRGNRAYVKSLVKVLFEKGDFAAGLLFLPAHVVRRIYLKVTNKAPHIVLSAQPGMGSPSWLRKIAAPADVTAVKQGGACVS